MNKRILVVAMLLVATSAFAADRISLTWVPSITPSANGTYIYRASGACPASGVPASAVKIGTISGVTAGFDDLAGTPGQIYCYYATAFRTQDGSESVASNLASATFPFQTLAPPTNLQAAPK